MGESDSETSLMISKCHWVSCDCGCFYKSDFPDSLNTFVFTHLAPELSHCKWRLGGAGGGGGGVEEMEEQWEWREAYWGQQRALLSVISIQICRIRCSECGTAQGWKLVLFPTQPWSRQGQIQTNEFTQTIHMERWQYRGIV